jgi:hypothetical protein
LIRFYIDDIPLLETDPNKLTGIIFSSIKDLKWWSYDALLEFVEGTYEQLKIYSEERKKEIGKDKFAGREKTKLTKFMNLKFRLPNNHDQLLAFIYKQILISEKKGLLHGYGIDGITGVDAEKITIREFQEK